MRRGLFAIFAAVLLLATAAPLASARQARQLPALPSRLPLDPAPAAPADQVSGASPPPTRASGPGPGDWAALLGLSFVSLGMLALGLAAARRARRRKVARPPRKTREGGRTRARALAPQTLDAAL